MIQIHLKKTQLAAMSSSTSSSSSGDKKTKSKRVRGFLGLRWLGSSSSSDSMSLRDRNTLMNSAGSSSDTAQPIVGFMSEGSPDWANPDWEMPQPKLQEEFSILPFPCQITCSLTILSRRPIRDFQSLMRKLELWIDQYNGSYACKPYHTLIYILLGAKLVARKSTSRNHEYHSKFQGVVRFGILANRNKPPSGKFRLVMTEGLEDAYYAISFECHMSESKRKGVIYSDLYKLNGYHYSFPAMLDLLNLDIIINSEGLIASS